MNPLQPAEVLIKATAALARKRGISGLVFTAQDIGDLYHVYGVNASAEKFLAKLQRQRTP